MTHSFPSTAPVSARPRRSSPAANRRLRGTVSWLFGSLALAAAAAAQTPAPAPDLQAMVSAGQTTQALQWLDEQSSLSPWDARLIAQRAMLLSLLHRDQQALRLLEDLASRQPAEPASYNLMALIHVGSGDFESARIAAQRALRANIGYVPALKTLAEIEMRLARQYYDHASRIDRGADPTLARRAAALTDVIGKPASAFAQPGALLALAPAVMPSAARATSPTAVPAPAEDGLAITLSRPPEPPPSSAVAGKPSQGQPLIALSAVPAAPAGVLVHPPGGGAAPPPVTGRLSEGGTTTTFASLAGGAAPAGFFGNARLTAVAPAPIGAAPPAPPVRVVSLGATAGGTPGGTTAVRTAAAPAPVPAAPPAPAPAPATTPTPTPGPTAAPAAAAAQQAEVDAALRRWSTAWSRRDVAGYLAAYDDSFSGRFTAANGGRAAWERERSERIGGRSDISVELSDVVIRVDGDHAETRFRQRYQSGPLNTVDSKTLHWRRGAAGGWLITREIVGG